MIIVMKSFATLAFPKRNDFNMDILHSSYTFITKDRLFTGIDVHNRSTNKHH